MKSWKQLITCAFIIDGDFEIEEIGKINNEIEDIIKLHMLKNNITKCERTFMSHQVKDMINDYQKYLENFEGDLNENN
jgi:hypothetical protein